MDQIIARIASAAGISEELAKQALEIILNFLAKEGPQDKVQMLVDALGANDLVDPASSDTGGGLLGGMLGSMGGMGAAMAALNELTSAGLGMGEVKTVASEMITVAKENTDPDAVDEVINSVPGLSQIL